MHAVRVAALWDWRGVQGSDEMEQDLIRSARGLAVDDELCEGGPGKGSSDEQCLDKAPLCYDWLVGKQ